MSKILGIWENLIANVRREKLLSISNILVLTITFLLLGLFINVVVLSQTALRHLDRQAQVTVFFRDDFAEDRIMNLKNQLGKN